MGCLLGQMDMSPYTCFHLGPAKALICEYFPSLTPLDLILNYLYSDSITHSTDTADTGTGETSARVGLVSVSTTKDQVNTTIKGSVVDAKKFLCIQPVRATLHPDAPAALEL